MKKILPLLVLASTCLSSCGDTSFLGKYKFLLGRQGSNETRVSIEMELLDEASTIKSDYKNFNASFELSGVEGLFGDLALDPSMFEGIESSLPIKINDKGITTIPGFYQVQNLQDAKYGNKIKIAFDLGNDINAIFDSFGLNSTDIISKFLVSYCNGSSFTFQLPVSITDIQMQLAWYGVYIDINPYKKDRIHSIKDFLEVAIEGELGTKVYLLNEFCDNKLPGEQDMDKRYGSHPNADEVVEMNKKYQGLFSNTIVYKTIGDSIGDPIGSIYRDLDDRHQYFFPFYDDFDPSIGSYEVIMKEDVGGALDYDFSKETKVILTTDAVPWDEDGSYGCRIKYKDTLEDIDWDSFYQDKFVFRDFNDIKIELKKE